MAKETKVILNQSVSNLGNPGDVVKVKPGYARNFLLPQGLAYAWTKAAAARIEQSLRARQARAVATRGDAVAAKAAIDGTTVPIKAKVSDSGKLFGGVSLDVIAEALRGKAVVDPKSIKVNPIKTTGEFSASVTLHPEITAQFTVKVEAE